VLFNFLELSIVKLPVDLVLLEEMSDNGLCVLLQLAEGVDLL
jgi:hypothetical protein